MNDDCPACKIRICPEHQPTRPINLAADPPADDSGFLIVRFKGGTLVTQHGELAVAAKKAGLVTLTQLLDTFKLTGKPLITSVKSDDLERIERAALRSDLAPLRSLSAYWRVDVRHAIAKLEEIEAGFRRLPEVELVYREKTPSDPVNAGDDTYAGSENFLDAAPTATATVRACTISTWNKVGCLAMRIYRPRPSSSTTTTTAAAATLEITEQLCSARSPELTTRRASLA